MSLVLLLLLRWCDSKVVWRQESNMTLFLWLWESAIRAPKALQFQLWGDMAPDLILPFAPTTSVKSRASLGLYLWQWEPLKVVSVCLCSALDFYKLVLLCHCEVEVALWKCCRCCCYGYMIRQHLRVHYMPGESALVPGEILGRVYQMAGVTFGPYWINLSPFLSRVPPRSLVSTKEGHLFICVHGKYSW